MERLTKRDGLCVKSVLKGDFGTQNILHRLADYEDTGCSPEEFEELVNFIFGLNKKSHIGGNMDKKVRIVLEIDIDQGECDELGVTTEDVCEHIYAMQNMNQDQVDVFVDTGWAGHGRFYMCEPRIISKEVVS